MTDLTFFVVAVAVAAVLFIYCAEKEFQIEEG